jgi:hypothetical protein
MEMCRGFRVGHRVKEPNPPPYKRVLREQAVSGTGSASGEEHMPHLNMDHQSEEMMEPDKKRKLSGNLQSGGPFK